MRVRVLFFGVLKDLFSCESQDLDLPQGATVESLLAYCREIPSRAARGLWPALAVAVNRDYAAASHVLEEGDEVALLPPVSGGSGDSGPGLGGGTARVALVREPIQAEAITAALKAGEDGAVVVFDGIVRNNTCGRRTLYLEYEAYEEMALRQMYLLAQKAIHERGVRDVAIVHRLGRLEIGESSVFIAAVSAHRAQAFDACRWLIDTLKKTVPVWKREHFSDGVVWADGEPFPPELVHVGDFRP